MRWPAQVAHVARKDVRMVWWLVMAYAATVVLATAAHAEWGRWSGSDSLYLFTVLVSVLGMLIMGVLIQADSPSRSDAFWASRPLYPSAVFSAKLLVAVLVLLGLVVAGQLMALLAYDVPGARLPWMLTFTALGCGFWLAIAVGVAVLTPDIRGFAAGVVLMLIVTTIAGTVLGGTLETTWGPNPLVHASWIIGAVVLGSYQYRTRQVRRGLLLAGLLAALLIVGGPLIPAPAPRDAAPGTPPAEARAAMLVVEDFRPEDWTRVGGGTALAPLDGPAPVPLMVRIEGAADDYRYVFSSVRAAVRWPDGSVEPIRVRDRVTALTTPPFPFPASLELLTETPALPARFSQHVYFDRRQREGFARGEAELVLAGTMEVWKPRLIATLPLEAGAGQADRGRRFRILDSIVAEIGPVIAIRASWVNTPGSGGHRPFNVHYPNQWNYFAYSLIHRERGQAMNLVEASSGSSAGPFLGGVAHHTSTTRLALLRDGPTPPGSIGADWLDGAELAIADWEPVGSYDVRAVGRLRDQR